MAASPLGSPRRESKRGRGLGIMQIAYPGAGWRSMRALDPTDGADTAATAEWLPECLWRMGIVGAHTAIRYHALPGGVSSDIYRVELPSATICVKRALPKLRVAA